LVNEADNSATFGFALGTYELQLVLGHSLLPATSSGSGIKHWNIRKVDLNINRHPEAEASIKLADFLFKRDWTPSALSSLFKTTKNLKKSLDIFGGSVNKAMRFVFDIDEIQGSHCEFDIDLTEMKVRVEFFSMIKIYNFAIEVSYEHGFKHAKYEGTQLIPLVSNGFMISEKDFKKIVNSCESGWSYLKHLVETLDQYVIESEKN